MHYIARQERNFNNLNYEIAILLSLQNIDNVNTNDGIFQAIASVNTGNLYVRIYPLAPLDCLNNERYYEEALRGAEILDLLNEVRAQSFVIDSQNNKSDFEDFAYKRRRAAFQQGHFTIDVNEKWLHVSNEIFNELAVIVNRQASEASVAAFCKVLHEPILLAPRSIRSHIHKDKIENEMFAYHTKLIDLFKTYGVQAISYLPVPH